MEDTVEYLKKRLRFMKIMIGILSFITLASFVYCYIQIRGVNKKLELAQQYERLASRQSEFEQCQQDLIRLKIVAQQNAAEAVKQQKLAEMSAMEALRQNQRAEDALKKISKK